MSGLRERKPRPPDQRLRVVLVEDDDAFAHSLEALLEADGRFTIVGRAHDGKEGMELVARLAPDVVLIDLELPVVDGVEATRRIRRRDPLIPIVVVSGFEYTEAALEARHAGADDYVRKGRLAGDLIEAMVAALRRATTAAGPPAGRPPSP